MARIIPARTSPSRNMGERSRARAPERNYDPATSCLTDIFAYHKPISWRHDSPICGIAADDTSPSGWPDLNVVVSERRHLRLRSCARRGGLFPSSPSVCVRACVSIYALAH